MVLLLRYLLGWLIGVLRPHRDLVLENLALRQQLLALHAKRPRHCCSAANLASAQSIWRAIRSLYRRIFAISSAWGESGLRYVRLLRLPQFAVMSSDLELKQKPLVLDSP